MYSQSALRIVSVCKTATTVKHYKYQGCDSLHTCRAKEM